MLGLWCEMVSNCLTANIETQFSDNLKSDGTRHLGARNRSGVGTAR